MDNWSEHWDFQEYYFNQIRSDIEYLDPRSEYLYYCSTPLDLNSIPNVITGTKFNQIEYELPRKVINQISTDYFLSQQDWEKAKS